MQVKITGRHHKLAPDVQEYAEEKLGALSRYNSRTRLIEVVLDLDEKRQFLLEVKAHVSRGAPVVVTERHRDAKGAIDLAHDALERALRRAKERSMDRHRRGAVGAGGVGAGPVAGGGEEE